MKIFAYPAHCDGKHTPGVDFARIIQPMKELGKQPGFKVKLFKGEKNLDWRKVAKEYDVFYLNYITNAAGFVMANYHFWKEKKKTVFDIDDLIWEIQEDNAAYKTYSPGSEGRATITDIIARGVDFVTCTNDFLRRGMAEYTGKSLSEIRVLPNYINLELYKWRSKPKDKYEVTISYFGSSSHFNDLVNEGFLGGMERLMAEYPQVRFYTIGAMIQQIKQKFSSRYTTGFGDHDIYKWVKMMPLLLQDTDIFVAPLVDVTYARAKSSIKFLEYSSTQIPGVYQDIRQYQEVVKDGENGFLCKTADDWYKALKKLVEDKKLRRKMGLAAYKTAEEWTIQKNIDRYVDFFGGL